MYPYGDTRADIPAAYDEDDERAARWTLRFLGVALFVAVLAGTLVLTLASLEDNERTAPRPDRGEVVTVTTLPPAPELGPAPGTALPAYLASRKAALAANQEERVAVVSLAKYSTQAQAKALAGTLAVEALLVAPPGLAPAVVRGDLAAWTTAQTAETRTERDEIKKLIPTVDDPAFKTFYNQEVVRLDKALQNFSPTSAMVFGLVVRGPAAALKTLGARGEVRLVDLGSAATAEPNTVFRGLRPEETAKANEPPLRPI